MKEVKNILIAGVGGQGTILAARVLSRLLLNRGYDLKVSEIHGMSQRGGSVVTQVRYGEAVAAPIIAQGSADYILAFEKLEALRMAPYLKRGGTLIANDRGIDPMPVTLGLAAYPTDIEEFFAKTDAKVLLFDAFAQAQAAGNSRALNMVLLGAWTATAGFPVEEGLAVLKETVPQKLLAVNEKAFRSGYQTV